jgi:RNA polymerase sigma factor (sigma-70 family)
MPGFREAADQPVLPPRLRQVELIVRRTRPELVRVLRSFRIPPEDARDLLQNVYLAYVERADEIRDPDAWMVVAVRRECLHHVRAERHRMYEAIDESLLDLVACPDACPPQERHSLLDALARKIAQLGERCRELLRLRYGLGCDRFETAEGLGVRPSSIGTLERRCLAELSERMILAEPAVSE